MAVSAKQSSCPVTNMRTFAGLPACSPIRTVHGLLSWAPPVPPVLQSTLRAGPPAPDKAPVTGVVPSRASSDKARNAIDSPAVDPDGIPLVGHSSDLAAATLRRQRFCCLPLPASSCQRLAERCMAPVGRPHGPAAAAAPAGGFRIGGELPVDAGPRREIRAPCRLQEGLSARVSRILVCHDMSGGYLSDK
jgi:hypothetical protein